MSYTIEHNRISIQIDPEESAIAVENAELLAEGSMMTQGGITIKQLMNVLVMRGHLVRTESFKEEVEGLFKQGVLRKPIPRGNYLIPWTEREKVYVGNIEKVEQPERKWWQYWAKPEVELRPDFVLERLAREGEFHSLVISE